LRETVASFAQREIAPIAAEVDRKNEFPMEMWEKLGEMGLLGVTVKEDDGGLGKGCVRATLPSCPETWADSLLRVRYLDHLIVMEEVHSPAQTTFSAPPDLLAAVPDFQGFRLDRAFLRCPVRSSYRLRYLVKADS
jgi:alkylation response protein AidB-like acyl-CoA dehydrogenase